MRSRQQSHLRINGANIEKLTTIQALTIVQNQFSNRFLLDLVKDIGKHLTGDHILTEFLDELSSCF